MAIQKNGNKVWASINDLSLIQDIRDGDKFLVQTAEGTTTLLDFASFIITLDNVSFGSQFNEMWNSYSASSDQIDKIGTSTIVVNNLSSDQNNLSDAVNQLNLNDISNYNEVVTGINTLIEIINLNPASFPNLPVGVTIPLDPLPLKS